jgi:ubiquitin carboxyl-terminal hydrolase 25
VDREKVAEALEVLAELKQQQNQSAEAGRLEEAAGFVRAAGFSARDLSAPSRGPPYSAATPTTHLDTPPGLRNIGNTCYLNSLLQYFYNVKTIRGLLDDFDQLKLELDDYHINNRRTGGSGNNVNLDEAIVARQCKDSILITHCSLS